MTQDLLKGTEEANKEISWGEALSNTGGFYKFEIGKRVQIGITGWKIVEVEKADFNNPDVMKTQAQFEAQVISENGEETNQKLSILSKRFMAAVRPFLEEKDNSETVILSIKKIGDAANPTSISYDAEAPQ